MRYSILFLLVLTAVVLAEYRSHDGSGNNVANPTWGKSNMPMSRLLAAHYPNGFQAEPVAPLHPRTASNIFASDTSYPKKDVRYTKEERISGLNPNPNSVNMLAIEMMQFVLHDLSELFVDFGLPNVMANFGFRTNNPNDPMYEQNPPPGFENVPSVTRNYPRDLFLVFTPFGQNVSGVNQGVNRVTSYLDLSQVYGTDSTINAKLRSGVDGKMKINADGFLPKSSELGVRSQCGGFGGDAFGSGDPRIDTTQRQVALHTFMVRKHNSIADSLKSRHPTWTDETLYQEARRRLIAIYQHIVYDDLLPVFIGHEISHLFIGNYDGYDSSSDPTISHEFAIAFSRIMGHLTVNLPQLNLFHNNCTSVIAPGTDDGYFNLNNLEYYEERISCAFAFTKQMGLDNAIKSALIQFARNPRRQGIVNIMRNGKSKGSTPGNLDIFMNDVIRHRQFGVPSFYELTKALRGVDIYRLPGCRKETDNQGERDSLICFLYIAGNASRAFDLQFHYRTVSAIDANVGFLVEWDRSSSGVPLTAAIGYAKEFKKIRKSDRFFYKNGQFSNSEIRAIERESLASIIRDVSGLPRNAIPDDVFHVVDDRERRRLCPAE